MEFSNFRLWWGSALGWFLHLPNCRLCWEHRMTSPQRRWAWANSRCLHAALWLCSAWLQSCLHTPLGRNFRPSRSRTVFPRTMTWNRPPPKPRYSSWWLHWVRWRWTCFHRLPWDQILWMLNQTIYEINSMSKECKERGKSAIGQDTTRVLDFNRGSGGMSIKATSSTPLGAKKATRSPDRWYRFSHGRCRKKSMHCSARWYLVTCR